MSRPGITKDQVFAAAEALAEEGLQPTVKLVRDRIGGSFSTITPHLAAWKEEHGTQSVAQIPDMPESVAAATRQLWAAAWKAAQDVVSTEREGLAAARREMDKERAEMADEITALERALEERERERETLTRGLDDERAKHQALNEELAQVRIENARLEERAQNAHTRADDLALQVEKLQNELARLADERSRPAPKKRS